MTCPRCGKPGDFKVYDDGTLSVNCLRCLEYKQQYRAGTLPGKVKPARTWAVPFRRARTDTRLSILDK